MQVSRRCQTVLENRKQGDLSFVIYVLQQKVLVAVLAFLIIIFQTKLKKIPCNLPLFPLVFCKTEYN